MEDVGIFFFFFFQAEDGIRDLIVTGVQTCALPISETISAALLHDTVEDTKLTADEVQREFGPEVARLVDGVTKLGRISLRTDQQQQAENIRKMMVAMAED